MSDWNEEEHTPTTRGEVEKAWSKLTKSSKSKNTKSEWMSITPVAMIASDFNFVAVLSVLNAAALFVSCCRSPALFTPMGIPSAPFPPALHDYRYFSSSSAAATVRLARVEDGDESLSSACTTPPESLASSSANDTSNWPSASAEAEHKNPSNGKGHTVPDDEMSKKKHTGVVRSLPGPKHHLQDGEPIIIQSPNIA